jgi:4-amino-4-deoxy-L-arabinose transferase-like glycosyltransferase
MKPKKKFLLIIFLLTLGFVFRYILSQFNDFHIGGDNDVFESLTRDILAGRLAASCCVKNAGYSMFLAGIYAVFGMDNVQAIRITQIITDLITALLLYKVAQKIFSQRGAFYVFLIYIANPFTSSFAGLRLTEVLTFFLIAVLAITLSHYAFKTSKFLWFLFGLTFGILQFVRIQFHVLFLLFTAFTGIFYFKRMLKLQFIVIALIGYIIANSYSLVSYYKTFGIISVIPPYAQVWGNLLTHYVDNDRWPEVQGQLPPWMWNMEFNHIAAEYAVTPYTQWPQIEQKNRILFFRKFPTDWRHFLFNTGRNIIWLLDKYHISEFYDPYYPGDIIPIRIYNILLFCFCFWGILVYHFRNRSARSNLMLWFTISLFFNITLFGSFFDNESRHTLPFYPLLMLWAGQGCNYFQDFIAIFIRGRNQSK